MNRLRVIARRVPIKGKLFGLTAVLIAVIAGIIVLSAHSTSVARRQALVNNVAGRQPVLVQKYFKEVLLVSNGFTADPDGTGATLVHDADALLDGGAVLAVQGNDDEVHIGQQTDPAVRAKLEESRRLIDAMIAAGRNILTLKPGTDAYTRAVVDAEMLSHVTTNVAHDAVGRMTVVSQQAVLTISHEEMVLAGVGILLALGLSWMLGSRLVKRLRELAEFARAAAIGDRTSRSPITSNDELGELAQSFNDMADSLAGLIGRLEQDAERDGFGSDLMEAFEMADEESQAHAVVVRAMGEISSTTPMELLLADSSVAHLERKAEAAAGAPGCPVESPFSCVAVRRGSPVVFESSEELNACPKLRGRPGGPCSAVCVPISFMGKALGVLHATAPEGAVISEDKVREMTTLAAQTGSRIGTVRAFQQSQLQATTDGLTGLINRRTLENKVRDLIQGGRSFSIAMADLDHFKKLNDTFGHEGGDRALRLFTQTMRSSVRSADLVSRYGGEEFVLVFPDTSAVEAAELLERLRVVLSGTLSSSGSPAFTASFGVTDSYAGGNVDELLRIADEALMRAKAEGRDRIVVAS
jgi:diguanylate cyclase (GGDEF)-like protein